MAEQPKNESTEKKREKRKPKRRKFRERIHWKNHLVTLVGTILGVYIAFALSDWQSARARQQRQQESIRSLQEELRKDQVALEEGLKETDTLVRKITGLLRYNAGDIPHSDSVGYFLQGILQQPTFYPNNFTFQSLVNSGEMGSLIDVSFRRNILELYNGHYATIKELDAIGMKNFQDHVIATVIAQGGRFEDEFLKSGSFAAMAGVIQDLLKGRREAYKDSLELINEVLNQIEKEDV